MIIGISGKIGSGKDTVGKMIQWLSSEKLRETWLNDLSAYLDDDTLDNSEWEKYEVRKFADALKDIVCRLIGCTREQLEDREFKNKELGSEWDYKELFKGHREITLDQDNEFPHIPFQKMTPRIMLQLLGTEAGRRVIHPNIWVNATFADYKATTESRFGVMNAKTGEVIHQSESVEIEDDILGQYPNWIITDMRFPNEKQAIEEKGGITIRIERPTEFRFPNLWESFQKSGIDNWEDFLRAEGEYEKVYHASETGLDNVEDWDYQILNDTNDLNDVLEKVRALLDSAYFRNRLG